MNENTLLIDDYKVIRAMDAMELTSKVTHEMERGWHPSGPIVSHDMWLHQPMVKMPEVFINAYRDMLQQLED